MAKKTKGKDVIQPAPRGSRRQRTVFVFTEGRVTEPKYIEAVKIAAKLRAQVWCLFDHDGRDHNQLTSVLKRAEDHGVRVAFSHPCFEPWRLLHLKSANGTFGGVRGQAEGRLPAHFHQVPGGIKYVIPEQVRGGYEDARKRAMELNSQHAAGKPLPACDPYTDVHRFVEDGMGVTAY